MSGPFGSSSFNHLTSSGFYNGVINQSLRLRVGGNYKLDRQMVTPTSVTGTICTASWWMKKAARGTVQSFIQCRDNQSSGEYAAYWTYAGDDSGTDHHAFRSGGSDSIKIGVPNTIYPYDDPAAWYHVVIRFDSTQSTAADRIRIYKNGQLQNSLFTATDYPTQNEVEQFWNNAGEHLILFGNGEDSGDSFDGYIAEFNWVDGQSLAPETFGESKNGIWIPKKITLSTADYGLNGSRYTFADSSDIGKDTSGVGNDLDRVSNVNVSDVVPDSPENNFPILNARIRLYNTSSYFANGALTHVSNSTGVTSQGHSTIGVQQDAGGKWYAECRLNAFTNGSTWIGVCRDVPKLAGGLFVAAARSNGYAYKTTGNKTTTENDGSSYGNSYTAGDIIGIALDLDNDQIFFYKNGTIQNSGTAAFTSITALNQGTADTTQHFVFGADTDPGNNFTFNFGADSTFHGYITAGGNADANGIGDFAYPVPTGYLALCTDNLPEPTIGPNSATTSTENFNTVLYTGDGSGQGITGVGFQPDWVWIKSRSHGSSNVLTDSSRGVTESLFSNNDDLETTLSGGVTAFGNDGFTLGIEGTVNTATRTYVAWNWKLNGGTTATNSNGSLTSTTQANTDAGVSIILYNGGGSAGDTIGHGLNSAPTQVWFKRRDQDGNWMNYFKEMGNDGYINLDRTNGKDTGGSPVNGTDPSSTVITLGSFQSLNGNTKSYIAYAFHSVEGFSKTGKYDGNGSTDGTFIYTGFQPAWLLIKRTDASNYWLIVDEKRVAGNASSSVVYYPHNPMFRGLYTNLADQENQYGNAYGVDFLSNGFKHKDNVASVNASGGGYLYLAFAKAPLKYANGF